METRINEIEKQLEKIFEGYPASLEIVKNEIERVKIEEKPVGIDPESWLAKEILWQSRKLIELEKSLGDLTSSIKLIYSGRSNCLMSNNEANSLKESTSST